MKKIESNQRNVKFSYCDSPVTIDKSKSWGEGNLQEFPNGVYLKHDDQGNISHGVQPNEDATAPIGWIQDTNGYKKLPIWIGEEFPAGIETQLDTLDGVMNYKVEKDSIVCYNGIDKPNLKDCWIQTLEEINKNYII